MTNTITRRTAILGTAGALLLSGLVGSFADAPKTLKLAIILQDLPDVGWDQTLLDTLEQLKQERPEGLEIAWEHTDPLYGDDAENAMRFYAESGEYDIIWSHGTYSDQVQKLSVEFPDLMFVVTGSGNHPAGPNQYWIYKRLHEPSYLLGMLAGHTTKTGMVGVVGTFPANDVNDQINAFFEGAKSIRPDIQHRLSFIGSWSDNALAAEHANVQIAAGADVVFMLTDNFKPCQEHKIMCFANINDQSKVAPDAIASSAIISWKPDLNWIIGEWLKHKAGAQFNGNAEPRWFSMTEGGTDIAPYHDFDGKIPQAVKDEISAKRQEILSGKFVVPLNTAEVK
ncbi:MAG: BMP family ABC transporter substrate-binding protein [Mesorhizobium sp.]|nr:MAG: BMP family ABC transporter substrate-binding protein [Mesorhizobium sp.]